MHPFFEVLGLRIPAYGTMVLLGALTALGIFWHRVGAQERKRALLAAGAALLAMLGTEGENTDYAAHVAGLVCGLALGLAEGWRLRRGWPALPQIPAGLLALALPVLAWWWAFGTM